LLSLEAGSVAEATFVGSLEGASAGLTEINPAITAAHWSIDCAITAILWIDSSRWATSRS